MATSPSAEAKPKKTVALLALATVVAAVWSVLQLPSTIGGTGPVRTPYDEGYLYGVVLGAALVQVLVVWLVLYFAFVRKRDRARGLAHFLIMLGVVLVIDVAIVRWVQSLPPDQADPSAATQSTAR